MKTIKKLFTLCLTFILLSALALPLSADVIFEPMGDAFFREHQDECTHGNSRGYLVNTADGYAMIYESPISNKVIGTYPNGEKLYLEWYYTDASGEKWGITYSENGWIRISDLSLIYDVYSFSEEHGDAFVSYVDGSFSIVANEETPVVVYEYPGGGIEWQSFTDPDFLNVISDTYTDESGRVWGHYQGYYMGRVNGWICLSDPYNQALTSANQNESGESNTENTENKGQSAEHGTPIDQIALKAEPLTPDQLPTGNNRNAFWQDPMTLMVTGGILVGVLLLITGILIAVFSRKKGAK